MQPEKFFLKPQTIAQKQYEALRMFFIEKASAKDVAAKFGYSYRGFTTIVSDFRKKTEKGNVKNLFFQDQIKGRRARII